MASRPPPQWDILQQRIGAMIEGHVSEHKRFIECGELIATNVLVTVMREAKVARNAVGSGQDAREVLMVLLDRIDPQISK